uniref:Presequence protease, mitochondrial n=1 Tax=Phlebotomus papatasi TaxID=29031 RepID=A0A1B0DIV2_PHLPP
KAPSTHPNPTTVPTVPQAKRKGNSVVHDLLKALFYKRDSNVQLSSMLRQHKFLTGLLERLDTPEGSVAVVEDLNRVRNIITRAENVAIHVAADWARLAEIVPDLNAPWAEIARPDDVLESRKLTVVPDWSLMDTYDMHTNFVYLIVTLNTETLESNLRPYLLLFLDLLMESPVRRDGVLIPYEQVVAALESDVISSSAALGLETKSRFSCGPFSHTVSMSLQVEPQKYTTGVKWIKELLHDTEFTVERIRVCVAKMVNDVAMRNIIEKNIVESWSCLEDNPHEAIAFLVIGDVLYGSSPDDFELRLNTNTEYESFKDKDETFWINLLKKYFVDAKYVVVRAVPSIEEQHRMSKEEIERIERQRADLGVEGMQTKGDELCEAMAQNEITPPTEMLTKVPIPGTDAIKYHPILYPSDEEDCGLVFIGWRGPKCTVEHTTLTACSVLMRYLSDTSVSPLQRDLLEIDDPYASKSFGKSNQEMASFNLVCSTKANGKIPVHKYRSTATGLTLIVAEVEGPVVNGYFALATEAHDDDGLPHTLEHLIFLGSELYPYKGVLDLLANRCLASGTNAWTDTDHTCYTMTTAGSDGFLELLPIFLDHILYPTLSDAGFITEVHHVSGEGEDGGVVYCEMQGRENSGESKGQLQMLRSIYPNCGYSAETGGIMHNLRTSTTNKKVRDYHAAFYRPENLAIIVTGQVAIEDLVRVLKPLEERIFSKGDRPPFERPWQTPVEPLPQSQDVKVSPFFSKQLVG